MNSLQEDDDQSEELENPEQQEGEQDDEDQVTNPLALSDEQVMEMAGPEDTGGEPASSSQLPDEDDDDEPPEQDTEGDDEPTDEQRAEQEEEQPDDEQPGADAESPEKEEAAPRDIEAEHARLFAPLKAGKQTIEIKNVDEAIGLMQKGADYHRKTEELSAHRKTLATLERAGITADNLDYLIELHNKNPQAIAKLVADAQIDPFDIETDSDETKNYKPANHSVSDADIALDEVLSDLRTTDTYDQLIDVVGNKWDNLSRQAVATDTKLLRIINTHMESGIYPMIANEVQRQKALGQLQGFSDFAAYQQVGDAIDAQGGFKDLITDELRAQWAQIYGGPAPVPSVPIHPVQGSSDPKLDAKRRAAAPSKATSNSARTSKQGNPLALSDAEFEKRFSASLQ